MNWPWLFTMARRDSRRNRSRLLLFMGSISAGIGALVAIYSFEADLNRNVDAQAATLIGADLSVSTNTRATDRSLALFDSLGGERSEQASFASMVLFPSSGGTRLVNVRALKGGYPYYGSLETTPASAGETFQSRGAALVDKALLLQYNAHVGDSVQVGNSTFLIAGSLANPPGQTNFTSNIAPCVYIPLDSLKKTGLLQKGSRVQYLYFYKVRPGIDVDAFVHRHDSALEKQDLRYETISMRKESTGRLFSDMGKFMSLVGFVALLLGCIGVASAIQIYVREKTPTIAVMRCLGVTVTRAFLIYLIQILGIGLIGSLAGVLIGVGVQQALPRVLKDLLPIAVHTQLDWPAILQGMGLGLVIAFIFGLLPLLSIRTITPLYTLRTSYEQHPHVRDPWRWPVFLLMILFISGFAYEQLGEIRPTLFFTAGLLASYAVLTLVARALMTVMRFLARRVPSFQARQGFANLYRPNNQTVILVVSIGLSTALLCVLFFIQSILLHQLVLSGAKSQANMILFDIQTSQERGVDSLTRAQGLPVLDTVPIVSVRLLPRHPDTASDVQPAEDTISSESAAGSRRTAGNGSSPRNNRSARSESAARNENSDPNGRSGEDAPRRRRRRWDEEIRVTYRPNLTGTEDITAGEWIGHAEPGKPVPVSFEEGYARREGLHVGDSVKFNVQGMPIDAIVGSLRKVEWNRMQTNFRVLFPTGVLEEAPQFHVLLTRTNSTEASVRYQQAVVRRFPTVSIIDLNLILSVLDALIDKINYVIHFMAAFSIVTGLIVLIASVRNSKYQRLQESVLLRTLGASRAQVFGINALEYFFLGLLSGITGLVLSMGGAWLIAHYLFKLPFAVNYWPPVSLVAIVSVLTMGVGLLNSRGLLNRSTLEVLRNEA